MPRGIRRSTICLIGATVASQFVLAQEGRRFDIGQPIGVVDVEFNRLTAIRELADGSLLVVDEGDQRVVRAAIGSARAKQIGRTGAGPGEYRSLWEMFALPADSSLVVDGYTGRFLLLKGDSIVHTVVESTLANRIAHLNLRGVDASGHLLVVKRARLRTGLPPDQLGADSLDVMLVDRRTARSDTVVRIATSAPVARAIRVPGQNLSYILSGNPLTLTDQALLFADGWLAVAHAEPYRVDWRTPDGRWIRGRPMPIPRLPVTEPEKCEALKRWKFPFPRCTLELAGDWPDYVPAFAQRSGSRQVGPLLADYSGRLVIERAPSAASPQNRYDVVRRDGSLAFFIELPPDQLVLGFGDRGVYVMRTDEDDLQHVSLHHWRP